MSDDDKKIFVDEDWKSKVQREKEAAKQKALSEEAAPDEIGTPEASTTPEAPEAPEAPGAESQEEQRQPRFEDLLGMLATQALYALGAMPGAENQQVMVDLDQAAFLIEMLATLEEKTRGNLSTEEADHLNEARREIDRIFAVRFQQVQEQAMRQSGVDPEHLNNPSQTP